MCPRPGLSMLSLLSGWLTLANGLDALARFPRALSALVDVSRDDVVGTVLRRFSAYGPVPSGGTTRLLWSRMGTHDLTAQTDLGAGVLMQISSDAVLDQGLECRIEGLDATGDFQAGLFTTDAFDGQTASPLAALLWSAINLLEMDDDPAGTIYISPTGAALTVGIPTANGDVRGQVLRETDIAHNAKQTALYTVPNGRRAVVIQWRGGCLRSDIGATGATFFLQHRAGTGGIWRTVDTATEFLGPGGIEEVYLGLAAGEAVRIMCTNADSLTTALVGGFNVLELDIS